MYKIWMFFFVLTAGFGNVLFAQTDTVAKFGAETVLDEYYLGFNLVPSYSGGMVQYITMHIRPNGTREIIHMTKDAFMYQAAGKQDSKANPGNINFFEKFGINDPNVIDQLWKLRYKEYPYFSRTPMDAGWSANDSIPDIPHKKQFLILEQYGITRVSDWCIGDKAFMLLRDMENAQWIEKYKNSGFIK